MNASKLTQIITSFTLYKFVDALTTPFTRLAAYSLGIIDANGRQLKDLSSLTPRELQQFTPFDQLIVALKRIIVKVPDPYVRAHLTNVPAALALFTTSLYTFFCEQGKCLLHLPCSQKNV